MTDFDNNYSKFVEEYMAIFEPLFQKAFEISEFNLIMTMLAVRGVSDDGWNPFENTEDVFEEVYKHQESATGAMSGAILQKPRHPRGRFSSTTLDGGGSR